MMIQIEQLHDCCILHCQGRFIAGPDLEYMESRLRDIQNLECRTVIADFSEVSCVGSMGITFLVGVYTSVSRKPGGRLVLAGVNPLVRQVLDLTRISTLVSFAPDMRSALEYLKNSKDYASLKSECNTVVPCEPDV